MNPYNIETLKRYGIIGNPLGHSYSEKYFTELFMREGIDASYGAYQIADITEAIPLLEALEGMNVTYPYKEAIIPYLRDMDAAARMIGAVNVVHKGKGYNTDWIGFRDSLRKVLQETDQRALLLGTGGVSKAIQYALRELGIGYTLVSRKAIEHPTNPRGLSGTPLRRLGERAPQNASVFGDPAKAMRRLGDEAIGYQDIDEQVMAEHQIIVNCTPLGMHPYEDQWPDIPYQHLTEKHLLYDCIYNPEKTLFLQKGEEQGCRIKNGLEMLHLQADEAWSVWSLGV